MGPLRDSGSAGGPIVEPPPEADDEVWFAVGNPFRDPGRTLVQVHASGPVRFTTSIGDSVIEDRLTIEPGAGRNLVRSSTAALLALRARAVPRPLPDEAIYTCERRRGSQSLGGAAWPERFVEAVPQLACLIESVRALVEQGRPERHPF